MVPRVKGNAVRIASDHDPAAFLARLGGVVVVLASRLPVAAVPKEGQVALVWRDVIDDGRKRGVTLRFAHPA